MSDRLKKLSEAGVSIWLDDLSRERIETGNLAELIKADSVVGVTTNPSIFANALSLGERYDEQVRRLASEGADTDRVVFEITTTDVRNACDIMRPTWEQTNRVDGRVSIEVPPALAHDTEASVAEAIRLWQAVDRPNAYIKIPATSAGLPAISAVLAEGIDVNVTLIFGLERYAGVMDAYLTGLERAQENGHRLADLHSVASFFVSRVDTEVDKRLDALGDRAAAALKGRAGIANARIAYQRYEKFFSGERWERLRAAGANTQRPLWASTGVKNPDYDDTMYVVGLTVPDTVNTMPEKTLRAVADHGEITGDQVRPNYDDAAAVLADLAEAGIDYHDVIDTLETEGIEKFDKAWAELEESVRTSLAAAR